MRKSWLLGAIVCFLIGSGLTASFIGAIIGIPLIVLSVVLLIIGLILPYQKREVHIHHHKK